MARVDRTGIKYHYLTAIQQIGIEPKSQNVLWLWRCDCGKEFQSIYIQDKHSCGCYKRGPHKYEDFTGRRCGKLTILTTFVKDHHRRWSCVCDCGNYYDTSHSNLQDKLRKPKSCGCLKPTQIMKSQVRLAECELIASKRQQFRKQTWEERLYGNSSQRKSQAYGYLNDLK